MARCQSRRALIGEDEAPRRELLRRHLDLAGFTLEEAANGLQGLAAARSTSFDLILLDVMQPGLDGVKVCQAIRTRSRLDETQTRNAARTILDTP